MDGLCSWTQDFLTPAPLGKSSGFENGANCRCSSRAACLEVRAGHLCVMLRSVGPSSTLGRQNSVHGSFGLTRSSFSLPQDVHRPPGVWDRNGPILAQALSSNLYPFLSLASCRSATFFFVMSPLPGIHFPSVPFGFCLASQISSCASPQSGMTGSREDPHSFLSKVFV